MAKKRQSDLYYLLPGMARGARNRAIRNFVVSVVVGLLLSGAITGLLYYYSRL